MQKKSYTLRDDVSLMPWHIPQTDGMEQPCVLVAVMDGNEMQSVSLHVLQQPQPAA